MSEQPHKNKRWQDDSDENALDVPERKAGGKWLVWSLGGCLLFIIAIIGIPIILGITTISNVIGGIGQMFNMQPPVAQVTTTQTLLQSITPLGQLVSVSVQLAKADIEVSVQSGALNACGFAANHVAAASIEAGIDLNSITEEDFVFDEETDLYRITLPPAQLTSCRIDYIRQYDRSRTMCNIDWDEARLLANAVAMQSFRDDAIEADILQRAEREAELVFSSLVKAITGKESEITFREPDANAIPDSCQPQPPEDWTYDAAGGFWTKTG